MARLAGDPGIGRWLRFAVGFRLPKDNLDWVRHELTDAGWRARTVVRHLAVILPICAIIATLLLTFIYRHLPKLIAHGHVFLAQPPLYRIDVGRNVYYALDDAERAGVLDRIAAEGLRGKVTVTRFKGLGEMSPLQLRETTMAPATRRLLQLTVAAEGRDLEVDALGGPDALLLAELQSGKGERG